MENKKESRFREIIDNILSLCIGIVLALSFAGTLYIVLSAVKDTFFSEEESYLYEDKPATMSDIYNVREEIAVVKDYILKEKCKEMGGEYSYINGSTLRFDGREFYSDNYNHECIVGSKDYIGEDLNWVYTKIEIK